MYGTSDAPLLTAAEAALDLECDEEQLIAFIRDGELHYVNLGRGSKRPRYRLQKKMSPRSSSNAKREGANVGLIERRSRHTCSTTSKSVVGGFMARRAAQISGKPKR